MIKMISLPMVLLLGLAQPSCSTTVKGPVTKQKYNLEVGATEDMADYRKQRSEVVPGTAKQPAEDTTRNCGFDEPECSVVRQPPQE